jgi:hypothetical protein
VLSHTASQAFDTYLPIIENDSSNQPWPPQLCPNLPRLCLTINALKKAGIAMLNAAHDPIFSRKTRNPTRYSGANISFSFDKRAFQLLPNGRAHPPPGLAFLFLESGP